MFYLQKVVALVEAEEFREELELLGRTLQTQGIIFYNEVQAQEYNIEEMCMMENRSVDGCLWLTDRADWADFLADRKQAVLVYLHEKNRSQNFSKIRYACEKPSELDTDYLEKVYRRYKTLPWNILETRRCCIRETTEADVPAFYNIYAEPSIIRYMEDLFPEVEQEFRYVKDYREKVYDFYGFGVWTVLKKDTGEVIGRAGLSYRVGFEEPELGFIIGVPWQRQGYAEEVCKAILEYGWEELGFDTIQAFVMPENTASVSLCEKLGFQKAEALELEGITYQRFVCYCSLPSNASAQPAQIFHSDTLSLLKKRSGR